MKKNQLITSLVLSILIVSMIRCRTSNVIKYDEFAVIEIVNFDEEKFKHYTVFKFEADRKKKGYILVNKEYDETIAKLKKKLSSQLEVKLCRIHQYKPNNSDLTFRSNRSVLTKIYVEDELEIDLSEDAKIRYYQICSEFK